MQKIIFSIFAGISLAVSGLITLPANAQDNQSDITGANVFNNTVTQDNQSDITGTNIFNDVTPGFFNGNRLSKETTGQAEQLVQKLAEAKRLCPNINSDTTECLDLIKLLEDSRTFLGNVNEQVGKVRANQVNRAW
jgi:hypothetical protein